MKRLLLLLCLLCFPLTASAAVEMDPVVAPKPQAAVNGYLFLRYVAVTVFHNQDGNVRVNIRSDVDEDNKFNLCSLTMETAVEVLRSLSPMGPFGMALSDPKENGLFQIGPVIPCKPINPLKYRRMLYIAVNDGIQLSEYLPLLQTKNISPYVSLEKIFIGTDHAASLIYDFCPKMVLDGEMVFNREFLTIPKNKAGKPGVAPKPKPAAIRNVTFRAHLRGKLANDPIVKVGETIRVTPAKNEMPMKGKKKFIIVKLPKKTPYKDVMKQLYYLRGYAIGQLSKVNPRGS